MPDFSNFNVGKGDLEFIRQKALDGDWVVITGSASTVTDYFEYIPASGKTFFPYKIILNVNSISAVGNHGAIVKNNGSIVAGLSIEGGSGGTGHEITMLGDKMVGDGVDIYSVEVNSEAGSINVRATMLGWVEDT